MFAHTTNLIGDNRAENKQRKISQVFSVSFSSFMHQTPKNVTSVYHSCPVVLLLLRKTATGENCYGEFNGFSG